MCVPTLGFVLGFVAGFGVGCIAAWRALRWLVENWNPKPKRKARVEWTVDFGKGRKVTFQTPAQTTGEEVRAMAVTELEVGQQVTFAVQVKNDAGQWAPLENPQWVLTGPFEITVSEPPYSPHEPPAPRTPKATPTYFATVAARSESGTGSIAFKGDADMGEGVSELIAVASLVATSGPATVIELVPGPVEDIPDTPDPEPPAARQTIDPRSPRG